MPVAPAPSRLPSMAHRLPLLQEMAHRRHLGEDQPGHPRTVAGPPEKGSPAQRGRGGFSVGKEHRGGRGRARLRRGQEGQGQKAPHPGGHRGFRALKAKVHSAKVMDHEGIKTLLQRATERFPRLSHLWLDAGYRGEDKGADWVRKTLGWSVDLVERPKKPAPEEVLMGWAEGVGQRGRGRRVAANLCPPKASWCCRGGGWWSGRSLGSTSKGG